MAARSVSSTGSKRSLMSAASDSDALTASSVASSLASSSVASASTTASTADKAAELHDIIKEKRNNIKQLVRLRSKAKGTLKDARAEIVICKLGVHGDLVEVMESIERLVEEAAPRKSKERAKFVQFMGVMHRMANASTTIDASYKREAVLKSEMHAAKEEVKKGSKEEEVAELERRLAVLRGHVVPMAMVTMEEAVKQAAKDKTAVKFAKLDTLPSVAVSAATGDLPLGGAGDGGRRGLPPPRAMNSNELAAAQKAKIEAVKRESRIVEDVVRAEWVTGYTRDFRDELAFAFPITRAGGLAAFKLDDSEEEPTEAMPAAAAAAAAATIIAPATFAPKS